MLLTGKCKEDFERYFYKRCYDAVFDFSECISDSNSTLRNTLIVDWLDSVGIIISVTYCKLSNGFDFLLYSEYYQVSSGTHTRQQATEKAILKANEIYNNLNTKENEK
jgi:hypothetical protein